jgi:hypothetical protein
MGGFALAMGCSQLHNYIWLDGALKLMMIVVEESKNTGEIAFVCGAAAI